MPTLRSTKTNSPQVNTKDGIITMLKEQSANFRSISNNSLIENFKCISNNDGGDHKHANADYTISLSVPTNEDDVQSILPHWNDFLEAFRLYNPENQSWLFDKIVLPSEMVNSLRPLMLTRNIRRLEFSNIIDGSQNVHLYDNLLCDIMEENTSIKCLVFGSTSRFGPRLYDALRKHPSLEEIHITDMILAEDDDEDGGLLESILQNNYNSPCKNLKYISFNDCMLGKYGGAVIADFLDFSTSLEYLSLGDCGITNNDADHISDSLWKHNSTLRVLSLGEKNNDTLTQAGRKILCNALFNKTSLDTIINSNHTCRVDLHAFDCRYEALLNILNRKGSPKDNRRWKVLSVLYRTNGLGITQNEFKYCETRRRRSLVPEILAYVLADTTFPGSETSLEMDDESAEVVEISDAEDSADAMSIESDDSYDGYDSELEELDDAFEDEEDEVYEDFDKSFLDPAFIGDRMRLTVAYQIVKNWGLSLMDKTPPLSADVLAKFMPKPKKMRREVASLGWKESYNATSYVSTSTEASTTSTEVGGVEGIGGEPQSTAPMTVS